MALNLGFITEFFKGINYYRAQRKNGHSLLDCPVECIKREDTELFIERSITTTLNKELSQLRDMLTEDGNFLMNG